LFKKLKSQQDFAKKKKKIQCQPAEHWPVERIFCGAVSLGTPVNVAEPFKKYLQERRDSVTKADILKTSLVEIASGVERMVLSVDPNFEKDRTDDADF